MSTYDDPQDAVEEIIRAEQLSESPLPRLLMQAVDALPTEILGPILGPLVRGLASTARTFIDRQREARAALLIDTLSAELRFLKDRLKKLEDRASFIETEFLGLVLDTVQKAEQTRSSNRIVRMGRILANAVIAPKSADSVEELTRIAMVLDAEDVRLLTELVNGQRRAFDPLSGRVNHTAANHFGRHGDSLRHDIPQVPGQTAGAGQSAVAARLKINEGELQSRCAKLQSYGLIVQIERNQVMNFTDTVPYAVLGRGVEFVDAIQSLTNAQ